MQSADRPVPQIVHTSEFDSRTLLRLLKEAGYPEVESFETEGGDFRETVHLATSDIQFWCAGVCQDSLRNALADVQEIAPIRQVGVICEAITAEDRIALLEAGAASVIVSSELTERFSICLNILTARTASLQRLFHKDLYEASRTGFDQGAARLLHDINSPITAIQNSFEMIEMEREVAGVELTAKEKLLLKGIEGARQIADHWHEYLHAQETFGATADLHLSIRTALGIVCERFPDLSIQTAPDFLSPEWSDTIPPLIVQGSALSYELIFFHVLLNAAEAVEDSTDGTIRVELKQESGSTFVTVEDNGIGVHPDLRNTLWKDFQTTKREQGHYGMGLGIARYLLMTVGGSIRFAEKKNLGGAAFLIEFRPRPQRNPGI